MEVLSPALARNAVDKIRSSLKPSFAGKVDELLEILQPDGSVKVQAIHEHLFVLSTTASANASLNRLMAELNKKFEEQGSSTRLQITADKKVGLQRTVWFESEQTALPVPHTKELDAINQELLATDQQATFVDNADFVLLTFNEHELQQSLRVFGCDCDKQSLLKGDRLYYRLGLISGHRVVLLHSPQATLEAMASTNAAIAAWKPKAVIAMGIAFGVDRQKQKIGDVLISDYLIPYELARVNPDGSSLIRGARPPASKKLLMVFKQLDNHLTAISATDFPKLRFGGMFTGDKLIDSTPFLASLRQHAPEAIGGEMEGNGLYQAAESAGLDWIVVKAICDFADGHKNSANKEQDQAIAAQHAAKVVKAMLELCPRYPEGEPDKPTLKKTEKSPERFTASCRDLDSTSFTVGDAMAMQTSLQKSEHHNAERAQTQVSGIPVQQALMEWVEKDDKDVFALLGEYGMGKTINCQIFDRALRKAHQENRANPISLYFDLRHIENLADAKIPDIEKIIGDCVQHGWFAKEDHSKFTLVDIERWAREHGVVLLFDGLDEVLVKLNDNGGQRFTNQLFKFLTDLRRRLPEQKIKMLLSCRTQYFPSLHQQIDHFTNAERGGYQSERIEAMILLPFNEQQILTYLRHSLPGLNPDEILTMIASVHDLTDLSKRPYTLKLVSELIPQIEELRRQGKSVSGVGLYQLMVDRWLDRDDGKHHIIPAHKKLLASHLAAFLWRKGQRALPASEIQDWFHQWLIEQPTLATRYRTISPDLLEEDLRTATFLSRQDGDAGSRFQFAHSSLQEFFLANYLLHGLAANRPEFWAITKPSEETLVFLAQLLAEPENRPHFSRLSEWKRTYRPQINENLLYFALLSHRLGFSTPNLAGINLAGAQLDDLAIRVEQPLSMVNADFTGASLRRAAFTNLVLHNARFDGANLTQASFERCQLTASHFEQTELTSCMFYRCDLHSVALDTAITLHTKTYFCQPETGVSILTANTVKHKITAQDIGKVIPAGHQDWMGACAVLGDGVTLVTGDDSGILRLWDSQSCSCLKVWKGHSSGVTACSVLGDGITLVSAADDGTLCIWESQSGVCLRVLEGHQGAVRCCTVLGDGVTLASAGDDGTLRIWDSRSGSCLQKLKGQHQAWITACTVLGDGKTLITAGDDGVLRLWDSHSGNCLKVLEGHQTTIISCAVLGDGVTIVSADDYGTLRLWDSQSGTCLQVLEASKTEGLSSCVVLGDGVTLVSTDRDGTYRLWDSRSGACLEVLETHQHGVVASTVLGDGVTLISVDMNGSLYLLDGQNGACLKKFEGSRILITSCAVLGDGVTLASVELDGVLRLWDSLSGTCIRVFEKHHGGASACAVLGDGITLISGGFDGTLRLWDSQTGANFRVLEHPGVVAACAVLGDGVTLVSASLDGILHLWDSQNGTCLKTLEGHKGGVTTLTVMRDGVTLASTGHDGTLRLWDSRSGACLQVLVVEEQQRLVRDCIMLEDDVTLVSASDGSPLRLWDSQFGVCIHALEGPHIGVKALAMLGDNITLASACFDGSLDLWDSKERTHIRRLDGKAGLVADLVVLGDGVTLITASYDGALRLWDSRTGKCIRTINLLPEQGFVAWDNTNDCLLDASDNAWRYMSYMVNLDGKTCSIPFFKMDAMA